VTVGEALTEARYHAGLTVDELSERTQIRETVIRSIESDDYAACGGDLYVRGYVRAIAGAVGIDAQPLIREFDESRASRGYPEPGATSFDLPPVSEDPAATRFDLPPVPADIDATSYDLPPVTDDPMQAGYEFPPAAGAALADQASADVRPAPGSGPWSSTPWGATLFPAGPASPKRRRGPKTKSPKAKSPKAKSPKSPAGTRSPQDPAVSTRGPAGSPQGPAAGARHAAGANRRRGLAAAVVALVLVAVAFIGLRLASGGSSTPKQLASSNSRSAGSTGSTRSDKGKPAQQKAAAPAKTAKPAAAQSSAPPAPPAQPAVVRLPISAAAAFGPAGLADGDNPQVATDAIVSDAPTPWTTQWYATANFGLLKHGTGLLSTLAAQ
jgi:hypothetical protein